MSLPKSLRNGCATTGRFRKRREFGFVATFMAFLFLLAECISEVARGTAGTAAVARLGACYHEPGMRAGRQDVLEERGYMFWR